MASWQRVLGLGALGLTHGCIPFVLPPSQASIAGSGSPGPSEPPRAELGPSEPNHPDVAAEKELVLRGAIHPQQLFRSQMSREFDVGAGWRVDLARNSSHVHGPYAELSYLPLRLRHEGSSLTRLGLLSFGEILYRPGGDQPGWGATLAVQAEVATFVSGAAAEASGSGFAALAGHGELGLGLFAGVTHRELEKNSDTLLTAGISGRLPASAGFICCFHK